MVYVFQIEQNIGWVSSGLIVEQLVWIYLISISNAKWLIDGRLKRQMGHVDVPNYSNLGQTFNKRAFWKRKIV